LAASILGGVNIKGGEGNVIGVLIGTSMLMILINGMQMMGVDSFYQSVVTGVVLFGAVLINALSAQLRIRRSVKIASEEAL
jgi:ribose/xylose/arabinose/galactoside ABC-type transport system permease subunit